MDWINNGTIGNFNHCEFLEQTHRLLMIMCTLFHCEEKKNSFGRLIITAKLFKIIIFLSHIAEGRDVVIHFLFRIIFQVTNCFSWWSLSPSASASFVASSILLLDIQKKTLHPFIEINSLFAAGDSLFFSLAGLLLIVLLREDKNIYSSKWEAKECKERVGYIYQRAIENL